MGSIDINDVCGGHVTHMGGVVVWVGASPLCRIVIVHTILVARHKLRLTTY